MVSCASQIPGAPQWLGRNHCYCDHSSESRTISLHKRRDHERISDSVNGWLVANDCRLLSNPLWNRLSLGDLPWIVNSNLTIGWAIIFPTRSMSPTASWRLVPIVPQVRSNGLSFPFAFMIYFLKMSSLGEKIYQLHQKHQYLAVVQALAMGWDWPECLAQSMHIKFHI